jgi:hypothetical protein
MDKPYDILIQLRGGTDTEWVTHETLIPRLFEPVTIYSTLRDAQGAVRYTTRQRPDGTSYQSPMEDQVLQLLLGDGTRTVKELREQSAFYPVSQRALGTYPSLDAWVYALNNPYQAPVFGPLTGGTVADLEIGQTFNPNRVYTWTVHPPENLKSGSQVLQQTFKAATLPLATLPVRETSATVTGKALLKGTVLDEVVTIELQGTNTQEKALAPVKLTQRWRGRVAWFMHADSEWLVAGQNAKPGDPAGTYQPDETLVAGYCQAALNATGVLGSKTHTFGALNVPGGTGTRLHLLYPAGYRTSFEIRTPQNILLAPVRTREITLLRNGVAIPYVLAACDLRIVQNLELIAL